MKAKLYKLENSMKIELENGVIVNANPGTTEQELVVQAVQFVSDEYMDELTVEEVNIQKYKARGTKDLQKVMANKTGTELELIREILASRGKLTPYEGGIEGYNAFEDSTPAEEPPAEEAPKKKELKKQASEEEIKKNLESAKENTGRKVSFLCSKTKQTEEGVITGVRLDTRSNFIQYRIKIASGDVYGKGLDAVTFLS